MRGPTPAGAGPFFHIGCGVGLDEASLHAGQGSGPTPPGARPRGVRRAGLFFLAFASGFAVLTIEIAGARLLAPVYGLSAVPWTAIIGVILAALALGSHLGGRLADAGRVPLWAVLAVAGLTAGLPVAGVAVPYLARELLGFIFGAVGTAVILFGPPAVCLGAVVPYLIQADTESLDSVGRRAGDVSAAATGGSILGSFVTGFFLLPALPLPLLLGLTAAGLMGLATLSGWILGWKAPTRVTATGAVGLILLGVLASRPAPDTLFQTQTLYASVKVTERDWGEGRMVRELWQNGGSSSGEWVDTGDPAYRYVDVSGILLEPVIEDVHRMLVLGGAALSLPVAFQRWRPDLRIDVVEIDPEATRLAREYFAYGRADYPGIRVIHDDARVFLRGNGERYDVIYMDAFDHLLSVPWTLVTVEALTRMADGLEPGGLVMANVISPLTGPGVAFLQRFQATLGEVFSDVRVYPTEPGAADTDLQNLIVIAGNDPSRFPDTDWPRATVGPAGRPLTDAWAPVEYLQGKLFMGFFRWY